MLPLPSPEVRLLTCYPDLIHDERNSPLPYKATKRPPESPVTAYELLKGELLYYMWNFQETSDKPPTDEQLQLEACRIIYSSDVLASKDPSSAPCWIRDLLLSSESLARQAKLSPIRRQNESRASVMKINGKDSIFEDDPMERQLHEYVRARAILGLTALDSELQVEACNILGRAEESSGNASDAIASFLLRLVFRSTDWLAGFRQRASLPRSEDIMDVNLRSKDPTTIDSTIHNYSRLEAELSDFVKTKLSTGVVPSDADLQCQARLIIYEFDDGWNQTAADDPDWLNSFKRRHLQPSSPNTPVTNSPSVTEPGCSYASNRPSQATSPSTALTNTASAPVKLPPFFLNDANCYHRLARELGRWVTATMSPMNPSCHVPTDEELQYQARWILYDSYVLSLPSPMTNPAPANELAPSDDTWNQTAADNAEWLQRFKKDVGIITNPTAPGLPSGASWNISQGGSGFAPPYALPAQHATLQASAQAEDRSRVAVPVTAGGERQFEFEAEAATANKYLQSLAQGRLPPPGKVFCSRELETGLVEYVAGQTAPVGLGEFPSDEELRAKAREILGTQGTAADDPVLLGKFKDMVREKLGLGLGAPTTAAQSHSQSQSQQVSAASATDVFGDMAPELDLNLTDSQMVDILHDMDFHFGDGTGLDDTIPGADFAL